MALGQDALDVALDVAEALERANVPYAIGGALSYALWGPPRGTLDIDLNLFVTAKDLGPVLVCLETLGAQLADADPIAAADQQGMFVARLGDFRLDLFVASIPFSWHALRTRVRAQVRQRSAWFLSAEALSVFKLLFFRGKDQVDLERLVAQQGAALDAASVRADISEMMGEDDPRVEFWDRITKSR